MEWSLANGGETAGYLYFNSTDPMLGPWEFAPCSRKQLSEVLPKDGRCEFYGKDHPNGTNVFGTDWDPNALLVYKGQLLLARQAKAPGIVYALKLKSQEGQQVQVDYVKLNLSRDH